MLRKYRENMSEEQDLQSSSCSDSDSEQEAGPSYVANPFFDKSKRAKLDKSNSDQDDSDSDLDSESVSDLDSDSDEEAENVKEVQDDDEDPLITALKKAKEEKERKCPFDIKSNEMLMDLSFHPGSNLIAHATINGKIILTEYDNQTNVEKYKAKKHKDSIRSLEFSPKGDYLVSGGVDLSFQMIDSETFKTTLKISEAHDSPLNKVKALNDNLIVTGDEDGTIKLWDRRHNKWSKAVMTDDQSLDDGVTDFFYIDKYSETLVASSAEGLLQSYKLNGKKPDIQSEVYPGEMNCLAIVHRDAKLVSGCADGKMYLFNWGEFGVHSADFGNHPDAINAMVAVTDNVVITACEDGTIRAVHLFPNRFLGTVGHHEKGFSVERLDVNHDGTLVGSISHDKCVKFWNISYLEEMDYNKTKKPFLQQKGVKMRRKENKMQRAKETEYQLPSSNRGNQKDFFKELD